MNRFARIVASALLGVTLAATVAVTPAAAEEAPQAAAASVPTKMSFTGHGWGHGRGMGQWGAQGYALDHSWSSAQILDHFYGGTHAGQASAAASRPVNPDNVRIRLMAFDNKPTVVAVTNGTLILSGSNGLSQTSGMGAARISRVDLGGGTFGLRVETAATCAGPWTVVGTSTNPYIRISKTPNADLLQACQSDGTIVWYPDALWSHLIDGGQRTTNVTTIEEQLRSVVPRESPASWKPAALEAQSVAARSYALAGDSRHTPYADTCDTTLCQVYAGWERQFPGQAKVATTDSRTDAAISATAGVVRLNSSNAIARTEFSSSTGGWSKGGTFPAVRDDGDDTANNPHHSWATASPVDLTSLETAYGSGGRLLAIEVLTRTGLGLDGGRVTKARLSFSNGTTSDVTGETIRSKAGLKSDWFTPSCPVEGLYIDDVHRLFLNRGASGDEIDRWCPSIKRGERQKLTDSLARSDEWAGVQIAGLYDKILGRPADAEGRAYWLAKVKEGMRIEDIAAFFYGGDEYYGRNGSTPESYVAALYEDLLGRPSDEGGREYWAQLIRSGRLTRSQTAAEFYASIESRSTRVRALYVKVLGRQPDGGGLSYWAEQLKTLGDVALAAHLAASQEYYQRSVSS